MNYSSPSDPSGIVATQWPRYFARAIDLGFWCFLVVLLPHFFLFTAERDFFFLQSPAVFVLFGAWFLLSTHVFYLLVEPLLLSKFGTTFGKWLFNLKVRNLEGEKLTYRQALIRSFHVLWRGRGFHIPLLNFILCLGCYEKIHQEQPTPWDDNKSVVSSHRCGIFRKLALLLVLALVAAICVEYTLIGKKLQSLAGAISSGNYKLRLLNDVNFNLAKHGSNMILSWDNNILTVKKVYDAGSKESQDAYSQMLSEHRPDIRRELLCAKELLELSTLLNVDFIEHVVLDRNRNPIFTISQHKNDCTRRAS